MAALKRSSFSETRKSRQVFLGQAADRPLRQSVMTSRVVTSLRLRRSLLRLPLLLRAFSSHSRLSSTLSQRMGLHRPFVSALSYRRLSSSSRRVPNPRHTPSAYSPHFDYSVVVDPDGVLSLEEGRRVESQIHAMAAIRVTVLLLQRLEAEGAQEDLQETAAKYVRGLHEEWGLGDPIKQNGLLLFISVEDRLIYMSFGGGVEDLVTEAQVDSIISAMKIYLRSREYAKAIEFALSGLQGVPSLPGDRQPTDYTAYAFLLLLLGLLLPQGRREESQEKGLEQFREILWQLSLIREEEYAPSTCPHCLVNKVERRNDLEGFTCGHALCSACSRVASSSSLAVCPICKDTTQAIEEDGYAYIATPEEMSLSRITDICYRLRRLNVLHPRVLPLEILKTMETRIQCEDYVGARLVGEQRLRSLGASIETTVDRSSSGSNEPNSISSDTKSDDNHYGGGSPSSGKGSSW